jgi:EpsI family protein
VLHGLFVSAMGYVVLFVGLALLRRGEEPSAPAASPASDRSLPTGAQAGRPLVPAFVAVGVLWAAAGVTAWREPRPVALVGALDRLPAALGAWTADPYAAPAALPWWTETDTELRRTYRQADRAVDVHVIYFPSQQQSHEVVTYRASDLHRGARTVDARLDPHDPARVNVATDTHDGAARLTMFWYELDGVVATGPTDVKLRTLWHAVGRGRTNGAVICLRTADPGPAGRDAVLAELSSLAGDVHRGLASSLPGRAPVLAAAGGPAASLAPGSAR